MGKRGNERKGAGRNMGTEGKIEKEKAKKKKKEESKRNMKE